MKLEIVPVTQAEAFRVISRVHRHLKKPPEGWICGVGLAWGGGPRRLRTAWSPRRAEDGQGQGHL